MCLVFVSTVNVSRAAGDVCGEFYDILDYVSELLDFTAFARWSEFELPLLRGLC